MSNSGFDFTEEFFTWVSQYESFSELKMGIVAMRCIIPILWGLILLMIWRLSLDSCTHKIRIRYRNCMLSFLGGSALFYIFAIISWNILQTTGCTLVSILLAGGVAFSVMGKYREEYFT